VNRPQDLRGNDLERRVEVEQRHADEQHRRELREPAAVTAGRALFLLDVRGRLLQAIVVDESAVA
jgi:hypothetical protein